MEESIMTLGSLIEMYESGAFNIHYSEESPTATLAGMAITKEQAALICERIGWSKYQLSPFQIIDKTAKFCRGIKNHIDNEKILTNTYVDFQNRPTRIYGKTCDRIHLENAVAGFSISVIYNMPDTPAKYTVYKSSNSLPLAKCRTLKQVGEYLNTCGNGAISIIRYE